MLPSERGTPVLVRLCGGFVLLCLVSCPPLKMWNTTFCVCRPFRNWPSLEINCRSTDPMVILSAVRVWTQSQVSQYGFAYGRGSGLVVKGGAWLCSRRWGGGGLHSNMADSCREKKIATMTVLQKKVQFSWPLTFLLSQTKTIGYKYICWKDKYCPKIQY